MTETTGLTDFFAKVLLLEDESAHALLISRALKPLVGEVIPATTVAEARQLLMEGLAVDVVLADLNLPDSRGVEHIQELVRLGQSVVVLTSSRALADAIEALKSGAKDFLVKDFSADFSEKLRLALSRVWTVVALERERASYQAQLALLERAIAQAQDGFAVADSTGVLHYKNSAFRRFLGGAGDGVTMLKDAIPPGVHRAQELSEELVRQVTGLGDGGTWHTPLHFTDEPERAFDFSVSLVGGGESGPGGEPRTVAVVWVRDISESRRRDAFQREMVATTTHDLKGPLGSILISSELLSEMLPSPSRERDIALRMGASARSAVTLVDEFLSARRIQEGTFILRPRPVDIVPLAQSVLDDYRPTAEARRLRLDFESDEALESSVDPVGFQRVLSNLVSNALKFTESGGEVRILLVKTAEGFHVTVSDTGTGMDADEVTRIFGRFVRLERHSMTAGSGLGLFVVKAIVDAHGGQIQITSQPGKGTIFRIAFPADPPVNARGELIALDFT